MYELALDHYSPLSLATYDPTTGALYLEFDYDRLLDTQGEWSNGRHIDAVTFMGTAYPIIIHADDGPRDENGRYIFDRDTVDNIFTINVGTGHDPADGNLEFGLTDREDGTRELYSFTLQNDEDAPEEPENEDPVTVEDEVTLNYDETVLVDVLANDSDPEGGALTLTDAFTEGNPGIAVSVEDNQVRLTPDDFAEARPLTVFYTVEDAQGGTGFERINVNITADEEPAPDGPTLIAAVNVGGAAFTAQNGVSYAADISATGRGFSTNAEIAGTEDDTLYQTEKWAKSLDFETAVENGTYDVELNLAEIWGGARKAGTRVIDIYVEDELVFDGLDLTGAAGFRTAMDLIGEVTVTDGALNIRLEGDVQNAKLAGFSIWEAEGAVGAGFEQGSLYDDLIF